MSNSQEKRTVEAEEFVLRGKNGEVQARLCATERGPEFTLFDALGRKRARIDVAHIELLDSAGQAGVQMAVTRHGPVIWLSDGKGNERAKLATVGEDTHLSLSGSNVPSGLSLSVQGDSPTVTLREGSGSVISIAEVAVRGRTIRRRASVQSTHKRDAANGEYREAE